MNYRKLKDLKKLPNNPRTIKTSDFDKLCKSIKDSPDYFEARPLILSDRTGELIIIAGNQRFEAAKTLKLKEVPTYLIKDLTEEREKEIIIRDNVSNGEWDFDELANNWNTDQLAEWGLVFPDWDETPTEPIASAESFNFTIKCDNDEQLNELQTKLNCSDSNLAFVDFLIKAGL